MKYSFDSRVRYSETDERGRLSLGALVDYFQDCSTFQAEDIGLGVSCLKERGRAWILSSWQIVIDHMPELSEAIRTWTWAYEFRHFYGNRNYLMTGQDGRKAAWANSIWVMVDRREMKPVAVPQEEGLLYEPEDKLDMEYASRKILIPASSDGSSFLEEPFTVGRHHLDTNHHVNNRQYISMAQEYLPKEFALYQVRAEYRMQARLGDVIVPRIFTNEGQCMVLLCNLQQKPYAIIEFLEKKPC